MGTVGRGSWDLVFPSGAPERIGDMFATAVVADAVRRCDADLAQQVETCRDWHCDYRGIFRGLTALAASSPAVSVGIATDGVAGSSSQARAAERRQAAGLIGRSRMAIRTSTTTTIRLPSTNRSPEATTARPEAAGPPTWLRG